MKMEIIVEAVTALAAKSKAEKRKVGAVLARAHPTFPDEYIPLGEGYNHNPTRAGGECEDSEGSTYKEVVHAEVAAINDAVKKGFGSDDMKIATMYVSHAPCEQCRKAMLTFGIVYHEVVDQFLKFDAEKLDLTVVTPELREAIAKMSIPDRCAFEQVVLTGLMPMSLLHGVNDVLRHGAKKYKPNNWRKVDDPERYVKALERHWNSYMKGEKLDPDSGMPHLWHIATNIAFLIELDYLPRQGK